VLAAELPQWIGCIDQQEMHRQPPTVTPVASVTRTVTSWRWRNVG
jgi:hypothetical protein